MKAFILKEGTEVVAVDLSNPQKIIMDKKTIKADKMYFIEDVKVDPFGNIGIGPDDKTIKGEWAKNGFYGFGLPKNSSNYELLLIHSGNIDIC